MCDCIKRVEKMLHERLMERHPDAEITEPVKLENTAYMFGSGTYQCFSPVLGRFTEGKRRRKFDVNMSYTYCPFCGEKYEKNENPL